MNECYLLQGLTQGGRLCLLAFKFLYLPTALTSSNFWKTDANVIVSRQNLKINGMYVSFSCLPLSSRDVCYMRREIRMRFIYTLRLPLGIANLVPMYQMYQYSFKTI